MTPLRIILYDLCDLLSVIYYRDLMLRMAEFEICDAAWDGLTHVVSHQVKTDGSIFLNLDDRE